MHRITKINLSTTEKVLGAGVVAVGGFLIWSYFGAKKASAATMAPGSMPAPAPGPGPQPLPSPYPTTMSGSSSYIVTTQTDPLNVRQGPGTSYPVLGSLMKGSTVSATGTVAKNPNDGMSWTQVMNPQGNVIGWASLTYLTAGGQPIVQPAS